jgi:hypothetical protein
MNWLRDQLEKFMKQDEAVCRRPWGLRDKYIAVINDRPLANVENSITESAGGNLGFQRKGDFPKLLEIQRNAMLMFTSCGWFFDDISGIEAIQIMHYASRAIQLAKEIENKGF